ncbi:MAG TPA: FAD-binding oxidoreductase [Geminicoccus sp.]|jgi:glycine/D-amino acid oxidase-like deaminating enzyme|uniref:NAD(P)/FAD-dependent oxidoreductase n=1 Tax=Geminicoccus sp. TaxID=2024832 RepID=UPI002E3271AD|nr:FAD-binding oxidoreductase [Geminicoccus sp.]HEX2526275.1 FAD-binding oxidoreductase [Geminicoccus sp.]
MAQSVLAPGAKFTSYWWEGHDAAAPAVTGGSPPDKADVVVVGSGFTGLSAALTLARGGRQVVVLDSEQPGFGCSTRNGGQVGPRFGPSFAELSETYGEEKATWLKREGHAAYDYLVRLIQDEHIDCSFETSGHLLCAHAPGRFAPAAKAAEEEQKRFGIEAQVIPKSEQRREVGSDAFHGAILFPGGGALDPMLYHRGLLDRAVGAGAALFTGQRVQGIERDGQSFAVRLAGRTISARDVVLATNGYTSDATPWWRRRIIPIGSYIIATEEIDPAVMARICPKGRMLHETRKVVYYYRPSPDQKRILFGGRVALSETDGSVSAPRLHAAMVRVWPELKDVKVTHSWMGFVAFTFDHLPHVGTHDGIHHAMGYCGNGVPRATFYGHKAALKILGKVEGASEMDPLAFQTRPLYHGRPWFLAPSLAYYKLRDHFA